MSLTIIKGDLILTDRPNTRCADCGRAVAMGKIVTRMTGTVVLCAGCDR